MKTFKELIEAFGARIQPGRSLSRVYSSNFKLIQIPGKPGETSEPTVTADGSVIPAGYRKFRAGATVFSKASSGVPMAPDFRSSDDEDSNRGREIYQKHSQELKKLYKEETIEEAKTSEAPYILTLKKVTTRTYPGNVQVTLYYNDKLKKYFSVPLNSSQEIGINSESQVIEKFLEVFRELSEKNQEKLLENLRGNNFEDLKRFILEL